MKRTAILFALALMPGAATVRADIHGFGDFSHFTFNLPDGAPAPTVSIPAGRLDLASINYNANRSVFYNVPQDISKFTASFTFQGQSGSGGIGFFVLQNVSASTMAMEGFRGLSSSIAIPFSPNVAAATGLLIHGDQADNGVLPTSPVNLFSGDPIDVTLSYNGAILDEKLVDRTTLGTFETTYITNLPSIIGSPTAFVGLGAGSGNSNQSYSNFEFASAVPEPATLSFLAPAMLLLARRRKGRSLRH